MPTYEYRCPKGHTFELFHRMADDPPEACEVCGRSPVERLLFAPTIHFKGSGFYATDYGRKGAKRDSASSNGDGGSGEKKSEDAKTTTGADGGAAKKAETKKGESSSEGSSSGGSA